MNVLLILFSLKSYIIGVENGASSNNIEEEKTAQEIVEKPGKNEVSQKEMDMANYLAKTTFSLNGNGSVTFKSNSYSRNGGEITISGGRANLIGRYTVGNSRNMVVIINLSAYSGEFDASNNEPANGSFYLQDDGSLKGTLYAKGERRDYTLIPY